MRLEVWDTLARATEYIVSLRCFDADAKLIDYLQHLAPLYEPLMPHRRDVLETSNPAVKCYVEEVPEFFDVLLKCVGNPFDASPLLLSDDMYLLTIVRQLDYATFRRLSLMKDTSE